MSDQSTRIERDRAMILDPDRWPNWPVLPLKRRDGNISADDFCAVMLEGPKDCKPFVYLANLFERDIAKCPKRSYESLDALLADYTVD